MAAWELFSFNYKFNICAFWTEDRARLRANCQLTFPNYSHTKFKTVTKNKLSIKEYLNQSTRCKYSIKIMSPIGMSSKWEISTWLISLYKVQINCMFLNKYLARGTMSHVPSLGRSEEPPLYCVLPAKNWQFWTNFFWAIIFALFHFSSVFPFLLCFYFFYYQPWSLFAGFWAHAKFSPPMFHFEIGLLACVEGADLLDLCFKRWSFEKVPSFSFHWGNDHDAQGNGCFNILAKVLCFAHLKCIWGNLMAPLCSYTLCPVALQFLSQKKWDLFPIPGLEICFDQQNSEVMVCHFLAKPSICTPTLWPLHENIPSQLGGEWKNSAELSRSSQTNHPTSLDSWSTPDMWASPKGI